MINKINNTHIDIASALNEGMTYEKISDKLGVSLGTINKVKEMNINLDKYKIEKAIIWAAGWGSRLMPITENTPKPLVKVKGVSLIETIIKGLKRSGIEDITIVLGKQAEKFDSIIKKHDLKSVINPKWERHNNVSSYFAAIDKMNKQTYLIDGDLLVSSDFKFRRHAINSFAYSSFKEDSDDIIFIKKGKFINHFSMPKARNENVTGEQYKGIFYFNKMDIETISNNIKAEYNFSIEYESRYWFDFIYYGDEVKVETKLVNYEDVYEVDYIKDLVHVDPSYRRYLND